jgi:hypothetical protein
MTQIKSLRDTRFKPLSPTSSQLTSPASRIEICDPNPAGEPKPISETHGFLGQTSFSATIHHGHLGEEDTEGLKFTGYLSEAYKNGTSDSGYFQLGLKVLKQLPNEKGCHTLLNFYHAGKFEMSFHQPSVKYSLVALWSTFRNHLQKRTSTELQSVASVLFRNTSRPLKLEGLDGPMQWTEAFSGSNTRWETIGILFITFAYALLCCPDEDLFSCFGRKADERQALIAEMKGCIEACIELCRSSLNTLVCHLLYKNMLLETVLRGDASKFLEVLFKHASLLIASQASQHGDFTTISLELQLHMVSTATRDLAKLQFNPK